MASSEGQIINFNIPENSTRNNLGLIISKYLYHWPLFLLAFCIIIPAVYSYVRTISPMYEIKASLLIKDEKKNQNSQSSALHEIDLINTAKTIENEIEILKSRKLTAQVVKDLDLYVNYQQKEESKKIDLYDASPVKFNFIQQNPNFKGEKLVITIVDAKSFTLLSKDGKINRCLFGRTYTNNLGKWSLTSTKYTNDYLARQIDINIENPDITVLKYQNLIDVALSGKLSSTIVLSLRDQNARRGKDILNQLLKNYNLSLSTDKNKDIKNTISFLDQKIANLAGDLGTSEKGIEDYKSSKGLTDISLQSKVSLENLQTNDLKLNDANIQLNIINRIDAYVNSSLNSEKVPSANGISDDALGNLIDKLSKLQLQYQELAATTPETSPEFEPINRQIKTTKQAIKETVRNIKLSLQGTRDKLRSYNSNFETSIKNIPTQEREYINIKRQQSSKESLYVYYLQKREEVTANYAATLTDDKIIDEAYSGLPTSAKNNFYVFGLFLAMGVPIGLIFIRDVLGNKVLNTQDIKENTDIPIIAELPYEHSKDTIAIDEKGSSAISEQFRALRTRLHYLHGIKQSGRVTLVTSSIPGEGKSFVSTNLSISLSLTMRKTIILELDMRKPKILDALNLSNGKPGLSDYFMSEATMKEIIQESGITPNLHVISSGVTRLNPAELLERAELKELILTLQKSYDDIIIDSPPVHLVPDATIVSPFTDVCLYIFRQGFTDKGELQYLNALKDQQQLKNINIVFNGSDKQRFGYGYTYNNSYYSNPEKKSIFTNFWNRF